ncbi:hypothetical protein J6590_078650 [Homalodisca vitripennis]|nr:hypothetical protein J6590_078650 [Homalodisca vitripennis]
MEVSRPPRDTSFTAHISTCMTSPSLTQTWKYRTRVLSDRSADHLETRHMQRPCLPVSRPPRDTSYAAPLPTCLTSPSYLHKLGNTELDFSVTGQQTTSRHVLYNGPAYLSDVTIILTHSWKYRTGVLSDRSSDHLETRQQTTSRHVLYNGPAYLSDVTIILHIVGNTELEFSVTGQQTTSRHVLYNGPAYLSDVSRPPRDTSYTTGLPTCLMSLSLTQTWKYRTGLLSDRSADQLETRHMQRPCLPVNRPPRDTSYTTGLPTCLMSPSYLHIVGNTELEFSVTGQQTTSRHVLYNGPACLSDVSRPPRDTSYTTGLPTCLMSPSYLHIVGNTELDFSVTGQQTTSRHVLYNGPACLSDVTIILTHMTGQQTTSRHVLYNGPAYLSDVTIAYINLEISNWTSQHVLYNGPAYLSDVTIAYTNLEIHKQQPPTLYTRPCLMSPSYHGNTELDFSVTDTSIHPAYLSTSPSLTQTWKYRTGLPVTGQQTTSRHVLYNGPAYLSDTTSRHVLYNGPAYLSDVTIILTHSWKYRTGLLSDRPAYLRRPSTKLGNTELDFSVTGQQTTSRHVIYNGLPTCLTSPSLTQTWKYRTDFSVTGQQTTSDTSYHACLPQSHITQTWKYRTGLLSDRSADHLETRLIQRACLPVSRPPRDTSYTTGLPTCLTSPSLTQTWKYRTGLLSDRSADHLETRLIQRACLPVSRPPRDTSYTTGLPTCLTSPSYLHIVGNTELEFSVTGQQTTSRHVLYNGPAYLSDVNRPPRDTSDTTGLPTCQTSPSLTQTWKYRTDFSVTGQQTTSRHVLYNGPAYLSTSPSLHKLGNTELDFLVTGQQTTSRHVLYNGPAYLSDVTIAYINLEIPNWTSK